MNTQRLVNLFIVIALLAAIVLTVREAAAISILTSRADSVSHSGTECADLPARHSIHNEYDSERGAWVTVSEDGPTGIDGGMVQLFSEYRKCSG